MRRGTFYFNLIFIAGNKDNNCTSLELIISLPIRFSNILFRMGEPKRFTAFQLFSLNTEKKNSHKGEVCSVL